MKALYRDHPLFASFDDLRITTGMATTSPGATWYETSTPQDGDVLASSLEGKRDRPSRQSVVQWQVGDGTVLGIGCGVHFDDSSDDDARDVFVSNAIEYLADGVPDDPTLGRPKGTAEFAAMRERVSDDRHRPRYHFTPPANWLNDPNGVVEWNDRYHLFYQYNPAGPFHGTIHWGHAVSEDLFRWEDEPIALTPTPGGPDADGCWSGCFVDNDGTPTLMYTGGSERHQLPCLATSDDTELRDWQKSPENPVVDTPPENEDLLSNADWTAEFRDHSIWRSEAGDEEGPWRQLIGSGIDGVGGTALLFSSEDLRDWEYEGPFLVGDWRQTGPMWECPEFLSFDGGDLLHVSDYSTVSYFRGEYDDERKRFETDETGQLDHGVFYAPQSLTDDDGRTIMFGWLREDRDASAQWDAGWSGAMSIPRRLTTTDDGSLCVNPVDEIEQLRGTHHRITDLEVAPTDEDLVTVEGDTLEIDVEFEPGDVAEIGLVLRASPDGRERTPVVFHPRHRKVSVERGQSSLDSSVNTARQWMPVKYTERGTVRMRVFLDRSVVEVFANEAQCLSSRIYPTLPESTQVDLVARGGTGRVCSLDIWELELDPGYEQSLAALELL
ncbi:glycoside hydrolase family 32 protein [Halomicrococcus sp. NG-SE-24]|uniref:glycoside hydrolase family 32 protein n=1 Tax=Halomicrococcus sp. NG-SE-24 TaxID=3436928 RepID=UPI003D97EA97